MQTELYTVIVLNVTFIIYAGILSQRLYLLKQIPKESLSFVSAFHLIEHLTFDYLKELFAECFRVIAPGGFLLLETPSIDNISVSTKLFYTDPTHINPINPDAFVYFLNKNELYHL